MPFSPEVKTQMFIRCARLCCLCLKQCGTNIEAAHIIAEADGGTNAAENGIPLCLDCHQEVGGYSDQHPRGNKFRPEELRAHRDRLYSRVMIGALPSATPPTQASDQRSQVNAAVYIGPNGLRIEGTNAVVLGPNAIKIVGPIVNNG
jgi:hypothetical protein